MLKRLSGSGSSVLLRAAGILAFLGSGAGAATRQAPATPAACRPTCWQLRLCTIVWGKLDDFAQVWSHGAAPLGLRRAVRIPAARRTTGSIQSAGIVGEGGPE